MNELQLQYANVSTVEENDAVEMTLSEWLDTWLADYIQDVKPGTKVSYTSIVDNHIRPVL